MGLLERIKRNSEDWDLDEGKELGITPKFDCVKYFMDTDAFREFSTKYGLDSEMVASFCESFATHVDLPKEKWFKYHPPIKEEIKEPVPVKEETHYYRMLLTRHYDQRPFDETVCDSIIANGGVKTRQKRCKTFAMAEPSDTVQILVACAMQDTRLIHSIVCNEAEQQKRAAITMCV